jgi:putative nucleotidyltransferase with HDIG domain
MSTTKTSVALPGWLHDLIERHLEDAVELPVLPETFGQVMTLCEDEDVDARAIELVLERDPSLAANVLRIANSAAYGAREPIVSLQQAVSRLGLAALRNVVLGISLKAGVFQIPGHQTRVRAIWRHCALAAAYAREIARRRRSNVEAAFLCGLLHDIGRPVVLQATLGALAHRTKEPLPGALLEAAMDVFHAPMAARLVAAWRLAEWTVAVVEHHHEPSAAGEFQLEARITRLADLLAYWAIDEDRRPEDFAPDLPVITELGLYPEDVAALLEHRGVALELADAFH